MRQRFLVLCFLPTVFMGHTRNRYRAVQCGRSSTLRTRTSSFFFYPQPTEFEKRSPETYNEIHGQASKDDYHFRGGDRTVAIETFFFRRLTHNPESPAGLEPRNAPGKGAVHKLDKRWMEALGKNHVRVITTILDSKTAICVIRVCPEFLCKTLAYPDFFGLLCDCDKLCLPGITSHT